MAVLKYDPAGQQLWMCEPRRDYGFGPREVRGMVVDRSRKLLYVAANFRGANGYIFVTSQITLSGQVNWATYQVATEAEGVTALALASDGTVCLTGRRIKGNPTVVYTTFKLNPDSNQNETPVWAAYYDSNPGYSRANAIAVDFASNVYITGLSPGTSSGSDFVTISYDPNGNQRWVQRWSSAGNATDEATGIAVDTAFSVYVTGYATTPQGGTEIVTIKYTPNPPPVHFQTNGTIHLQLQREPGQSYSVETSTNLSVWQPLGLATTDVTGLFTFDDNTASSSPVRFYRTVVP
jgi:hypothetical protein